jgi:hypothetical protein
LAVDFLELWAEHDPVLVEVGVTLLVGGEEGDQAAVSGTTQFLQGLGTDGPIRGTQLSKLRGQVFVGSPGGRSGEKQEQEQPRSFSTPGG